MAVRRLAQRFEHTAQTTLSTAPIQRHITTNAERSVPELAAIFEAGAGGDADAFMRRLHARQARLKAPEPLALDSPVSVPVKERRDMMHAEHSALSVPVLLRRNRLDFVCWNAFLFTPSSAFSAVAKRCLATTPADSTDDEGSAASSVSTEPVSDDESDPDDQRPAEPEQAAQDGRDDIDEVDADLEAQAGADLADQPDQSVEPKTVSLNDTAGHKTRPTIELAPTTLESTTATTSTTTTETPTATAPATAAPCHAPSRIRAPSRPRLGQHLQSPSVLMLRSSLSTLPPSSTPTRERTSSIAAVTRTPAAFPATSPMPRRTINSRYLDYSRSDRFLEERQRNVERRQQLAMRSQQNAQARSNAGVKTATTATTSAPSPTRNVASRLTAFENDPRWLAQVAENRVRADRVRAARKVKTTTAIRIQPPPRE